MSTVLDLPRIAHPDFAFPGIKPIGPVKIDWSHPLSQGLIICILPQSKAYQNLARPTKSITSVGSMNKNALEFQTLSVVDTIPITPLVCGRDHFVLFAGSAFQSGWDSEGHIFQTLNAAPTANVITLWKRDISSVLSSFYGHPSNTPTNLTTTLTDMAADNSVLGLQHYRSGGSYYHKEYRSGALIADRAEAGGTETSRSEFLLNNLTAPYRGNFKLRGLFIWEKRVFTDAEAISLTRDPYQFLIPANNPMRLVYSAADGLSVDQIIAMRRKPNTPLIAM